MIGREKTPIRRSNSRRGLTLIEVMLAVVILGIGAGVLLLATARCLAVTTKAQRYSTAHRLIQQVSAEHPLTRSSEIPTGTETGTFEDEDGYRWEREITEPEEELRKGLYTIRTRVSWSQRGRDSFEEVTSWLYIKQPEEEL
jgi:prepilin-type N-terminal cleavage/methylation domain-containing protein